MKRVLLCALTAVMLFPPASAQAEELQFFKPVRLSAPAAPAATAAPQPIDPYQATLPAAEDMKLRVKSFDAITDKKTSENVSVLYAKGLLDAITPETYNNAVIIKAGEAAKLSAGAMQLDVPFFGPAADEDLTITKYAVMLSLGMEHYRKMYHLRQDELAEYEKRYADLAGLSPQEKAAVCNLLRGGMVLAQGEKAFGVDRPVTYSDAVNILTDVLLATDLIGLGKGADVPFTEYETEYCETNGQNIVSTGFVDGFAYEAIGRTTTKLSSVGDYILFENVPKSDRISIRYSIPNPKLKLDAKGNSVWEGSPYSVTLSVYANGKRQKDVTLSAWHLFGERDVSAGAGQYNKKYYVFAHIDDLQLEEGSAFMLKKDADNTGGDYYIDSVFFELAPPAIEKPEGFLDIRDYGAVPNDSYDDTEAIAKCLYDAEYEKRGVYIPAGTFKVSEKILIGSGITVQGAGMHHTKLLAEKRTLASATDKYWQFGGRGGFGLNGDHITVRDIKFLNTSSPIRGSSGGATIAITGLGSTNPRGILLENLITEGMSCGIWLTCSNSTIRNIRMYHTFADGIHFTKNSHDNLVENCYLLGLGDDAIAITSEMPHEVAYDMVWRNNTIRQIYWGRGIMISGGRDILVDNNLVTDVCHFAGILVWTEKSFNTVSAYNNVITNNVVLRSGDKNYGAILLTNNRAGFYADADVHDNEVYETLNSYPIATNERDGIVYLEAENNILQKPKNGFYTTFFRNTPFEKSEVSVDGNLEIRSR